MVIPADVSDSHAVTRMFEQLAHTFGERIEMLVNNAGAWMDELPIVDCDDETWDCIIAVNAARELEPQGVRMNAVAPGMTITAMIEDRVPRESFETLTGMTPLGRFGEAREVVPMVMTLLSPGASYVM